jgi:hypothetical protein
VHQRGLRSVIMADGINIDGKLFQERITHFINAWKADKRSGDTLFNGASSILVNMGKVEENPQFHKSNAVHVSLLKQLTLRRCVQCSDSLCSSSGCLVTSFRLP